MEKNLSRDAGECVWGGRGNINYRQLIIYFNGDNSSRAFSFLPIVFWNT